jgi:hypothetical protein
VLRPTTRARATRGPWAAGPARRWHRLAPTLLLLGGAAAPLAALQDDSVRIQDFTIAEAHPLIIEGQVQVKGFSLVPMAYHEGLVQLHPKLMVGAGYDSNVYADSSNRTSDEYLNTVAGVQGQVEFSENQRAYTDTEIEARDYRKEHNRAALVGRAYGQFEQDVSNGSQLQASGSYVRSDDPDLETGYEVDHGETQAGAQYAYDGLASRVLLRGDYENARFYTGDAFFTPHSRDYDIYRVTSVYGYRKGEASEFILRIAADSFHYLNEDQFEGSDGISALAGWRGALLPKVTSTLGAGIEARRFDNDFDQDPAYHDRQVARPIGVASVRWDLEESSFITLRAFSELLPSEVSNAEWYYGVGVSGRYRLLINAAALAGVNLGHAKESGSAAGVRLEQRDDESADAGLEYYLREGVGVRSLVEYDFSHSLDYNTFSRWTAKIEMALAY